MTTDEHPLAGIDFLKGATLLINKPYEWTSFDVVSRLRYVLRKKLKVKKIKVGHAGTLDPLATGLLIVCTGKSTKKITQYQDLPKTYTGTIQLGATTPSFDLETEIDQSYPTDHITPEVLEKARQQFIGELAQIPPMFSAIKVDGQPLYKRARNGQQIKVEPRKVHIYDFSIEPKTNHRIDFEVHCSKGTYIRSLAYDFGKAVKSGGHLTSLRRTAIGHYKSDDAWELNDLLETIKEMSFEKEEV